MDVLPLIAFIGFFVGFAIVAVLVPPLCKLAIAKGFVDKPGGRKTHETLTPPIGGLIVFGVFTLISLLHGAHIETTWPVFAAIILLLVTGAVDDYSGGLNAWVKFSMQFVAAGLIVLPGGAELEHLGNIFGFGVQWMGFMSIPFSIISVVLFINAINLMDGLDGLAGGIGFIAFIWLVMAAISSGATFMAYPMLLLMGCLAGFLFHNMRSPVTKQARLFLGDAGSMALGLILGYFCIKLASPPVNAIPPISIAWVIALPIIDTCAQFYRRARLGRHPFSPDRGHFHHHFIDAGYPVGKATALILVIHFILGGIGYLGIQLGVPQFVLTVAWIFMILTHMWISDNPERYVRFLRH